MSLHMDEVWAAYTRTWASQCMDAQCLAAAAASSSSA